MPETPRDYEEEDVNAETRRLKDYDWKSPTVLRPKWCRECGGWSNHTGAQHQEALPDIVEEEP
mgnify:CR=1 FL=1